MIYLDNSATTAAFPQAAQAVYEASVNGYYNVSSPYRVALEAEKAMQEATSVLQKLSGAEQDELLFTSGGTESDNTALFCAPANSEIVVSCYEHHAILNCIPFLEKRGCKVHLCPVTAKGTVDASVLASLVNENTSLVSIMQVNNEVGAVNDLATLSSAVKAKNPKVLFHSDGVQGFMHVPGSLKEWGVDLYSVSGHKLHGPKGIGVLYVKKGVPFTAYLHGGGQQNNRRSGTVNVPGILGLCAALKELGSAEAFIQHTQSIRTAYAEALLQIPDAVLLCPDSAPHILSIAFPGVKASTLQNALEDTVLVGKGSACTSRSSKVSHVLEAMGITRPIAEATLRLSFGALNTLEEVPIAADAIAQKVAYFRKYKRK